MRRSSLLVSAAIIALGLAFQGGMVGGQESKAKKKVETSQDPDFKPSSLTKLAVIVTGGEDSARPTNPTPGVFGGKRVKDSSASQSPHHRLIEDVFVEGLLARGYSVVARSDLDSLLKEKQFQASGLTEDNAAAVGKFLNVPAVLVVKITEVSGVRNTRGRLNATAALGARLLSVETGAILWTAKFSRTEEVVGASAVAAVLQAAAVVLSEAFPEKGPYDLSSTKRIDPKNIAKLAVITIGAEEAAAPRGGSFLAPTPKSSNLTSELHARVEDTFVQSLMQKRYRLVSRSDLQSIVKEQRFQQSGLTEDNAVAAGKLLNVPAVLLVRVSDFSTEPYVNLATKKPVNLSRVAVGARLIDVGTGQILWAHSDAAMRDVASPAKANDLLDEVAKEVGTYFPPREDAKLLFAQGKKLETAGQVRAAANTYYQLIRDFPASTDAKAAERRMKLLAP